jgi:hypothetical protein
MTIMPKCPALLAFVALFFAPAIAHCDQPALDRLYVAYRQSLVSHLPHQITVGQNITDYYVSPIGTRLTTFMIRVYHAI